MGAAAAVGSLRCRESSAVSKGAAKVARGGGAVAEQTCAPLRGGGALCRAGAQFTMERGACGECQWLGRMLGAVVGERGGVGCGAAETPALARRRRAAAARGRLTRARGGGWPLIPKQAGSPKNSCAVSGRVGQIRVADANLPHPKKTASPKEQSKDVSAQRRQGPPREGARALPWTGGGGRKGMRRGSSVVLVRKGMKKVGRSP